MGKEIIKFDKKGNEIYYKGIDSKETWSIYDENNNLVYSKWTNGWKAWYKYDKNNKRIEITEKEYKEIEFRKRTKKEKKLFY